MKNIDERIRSLEFTIEQERKYLSKFPLGQFRQQAHENLHESIRERNKLIQELKNAK